MLFAGAASDRARLSSLLFVLCGLAPAGCLVDVRLDDKACDESHGCLEGYRCVAGACALEADSVGREQGFCFANGTCNQGLVCLSDVCVRAPDGDGGVDAGATDAGATDAGATDAGAIDAGATDAGATDAGATDAGATDAGATDAGATDAGATDAGATDAGAMDAGAMDAGAMDAGAMDAGVLDGGVDSGIPSDWWDTAFRRRVKLTLDNRGRAALSGMPVLVHLGASTLAVPSLNVDGADVRFIGPDQTVLPHEIEQWTASDAYLWVRVPHIDADSSTNFIWMYFSNPGAADSSSPAAVWQDYAVVMHMTTTSSSTAGVTATDVGTTEAPGRIGPARDFDGQNDRIDLGSPASLDNLFATGASFSAFIQIDGYGETDRGRLIDKGTDDQGGAGYLFLTMASASGLVFVQAFTGTRGFWTTTPSGRLPVGSWHHVAVTYNASNTSNNPTIYVDGAAVNTVRNETPAGTFDDDADNEVAIGSANTFGTRWLDGRLDEVRARRDVVSASFIEAEHAMATDNEFVLFGVVQGLPD